MNIDFIQNEIAPLRQQLKSHKLYKKLETIDDIKVFTEDHVFAVWDFMSLLKFLQRELTCVSIPWIPRKNSKLAQFVNEITLAEESDVNLYGEVKSHFEMYLEAMQNFDADLSKINSLLTHISQTNSIKKALEITEIPGPVKKFVEFTFDIIDSNDAHKVAAAFTFGREDLIPDMFIQIINETNKKESFKDFLYYLNRHIELDGDSHGPLSLEMIIELCGEDDQKWKEVLTTAKQALEARISLWDYIANNISNSKLEKQ